MRHLQISPTTPTDSQPSSVIFPQRRWCPLHNEAMGCPPEAGSLKTLQSPMQTHLGVPLPRRRGVVQCDTLLCSLIHPPSGHPFTKIDNEREVMQRFTHIIHSVGNSHFFIDTQKTLQSMESYALAKLTFHIKPLVVLGFQDATISPTKVAVCQLSAWYKSRLKGPDKGPGYLP